MTGPVFDAGAVTKLALRSISSRERLRRLREAGLWPATVPSVVLTEALHGDPRKDFHQERLLAMCDVLAVEERTARRAARLRTAARRGSAVDAIVVAVAEESEGRLVLTRDLQDLRALAEYADPRIIIESA